MLFRVIVSIIAALSMLSGPALAGGAPLRLSVTDLGTMEAHHESFQYFARELGKVMGRSVLFLPFKSRTGAVSALKAGRVDLVLTGPAEYVVFRKLTRAKPVAAFSRPGYHAGILVLAEGGITDVKQLKGRTVAFGDIGSTSNHLAPMQILADHGLNPLQDIKSVHIGDQHQQQAWEGLKNGEVAAIGMNYARLMALRDGEKDLSPGAFRFITSGPDLPNDVLMAGENMDPALVAYIQKTLVKNEKRLVAAILKGKGNQKYRGMKIITTVRDSDYNYVRKMYRTIGYPTFSVFLD